MPNKANKAAKSPRLHIKHTSTYIIQQNNTNADFPPHTDDQIVETNYCWEHGFSASTMPMKDHFPIEPAFAVIVTIYKAQGRTIRRLIIFVAQHPVPLLRMSWEGLYVALSRVKTPMAIRQSCE